MSDTAKAEPNQQASTNECPCGHPLGGYYMCLNGRIYGPCSDENCGGTCDDTQDLCTSDNCACREDL